MKTEELILLGAVGVGGYLLLRNRSAPTSTPVAVPAPSPQLPTSVQAQQPTSVSASVCPPGATFSPLLGCQCPTGQALSPDGTQCLPYTLTPQAKAAFASAAASAAQQIVRAPLRPALSGLGLITSSNFFVPQVNVPGSMATFVRPAAIPVFVPLTSNGGKTQLGLGQTADPCAAPTLMPTPACLAQTQAQLAALPCYPQLVAAGCTGSGPQAFTSQCVAMRALCTPSNPSGQPTWPGAQQPSMPATAPTSLGIDPTLLLIGGGVLLFTVLLTGK